MDSKSSNNMENSSGNLMSFGLIRWFFHLTTEIRDTLLSIDI